MTNPLTSHLVIVEDDQRLAQLTKEFLSQNNFKITLIDRGDKAITELPSLDFDLVILDLMLPGLDGIEVCKQLRGFYSGPIIMLTAKSTDFDQVIGLEIGADDYIIKPVEPHVLLARIRAVLRRYSKTQVATNEPVEKLLFGKLSIDRASRSIFLGDKEIKLTTREFQLLWLLASQAGNIVSRDEILSHTRGLDYDGLDRTVDVRISKLRKKLDDNSEQPYKIKTIWGKGYLFVANAW